ncbi:MAG: phosphoribosylformylglycinamidine synthase II, partial [Acidobacteria bacterium]|nr:phosphoribosylformylglycinamidine synthase II [Acidobacteriota bacterium]
GIMEDAGGVVGRTFRGPGDVVMLLGRPGGTLGGSEYLKVMHGLVRGVPPVLDLEAERAVQRLVADLAAAGRLRSAHDCSDGGLSVTLAECAFESGGTGFDVTVPAVEESAGMAAALFGEAASQVVVSVREADADALLAQASAAGVPALVLGRTGGGRLRMRIDGEPAVDVALAEAEQRWSSGLSRYFEAPAA